MWKKIFGDFRQKKFEPELHKKEINKNLESYNEKLTFQLIFSLLNSSLKVTYKFIIIPFIITSLYKVLCKTNYMLEH